MSGSTGRVTNVQHSMASWFFFRLQGWPKNYSEVAEAPKLTVMAVQVSSRHAAELNAVLVDVRAVLQLARLHRMWIVTARHGSKSGRRLKRQETAHEKELLLVWSCVRGAE